MLVQVVLLKTRSTPHDAYEEIFSRPVPTHSVTHGPASTSGYTDINTTQIDPVSAPSTSQTGQQTTFAIHFLPVLEHTPNEKTLSELADLLKKGELKRKYGGMVFTSQRAVEGWTRMIKGLESESETESGNVDSDDNDDNNNNNGNNKNNDPFANTERHLPFPLYVVGPATERALNALLSESISETSLPYRSRSVLSQLNATTLGAHTGNGANLAAYILQHYNALYSHIWFQYFEAPRLPFIPLLGMSSENYGRKRLDPDDVRLKKKPLLFLVGEQRRDIIPKTLQSGRVSFEKQQTKQARESSSNQSATPQPDPKDDSDRQHGKKEEEERRRNRSKIQVDEVEVYKTTVVSSFRNDLETLLRGLTAATATTPAVVTAEADGEDAGHTAPGEDIQPTTSITFPTTTRPTVANTTAKTVVVVVFSPQGSETLLQSLGFLDQDLQVTEKGSQRRLSLSSTPRRSPRSPSSFPPPPSASARQDSRVTSHKDITDGDKSGEAGVGGNQGPPDPEYVICSIGPTTRDHLKQTFDFDVDVCAEKPTPEALRDGVVDFLQMRERERR